MMYLCENCGMPLFDDSQALEKALREDSLVHTCPYCGYHNTISKFKTTCVDNGFDFLSSADFGKAFEEFGKALTTEEGKYGISPEAYLGYALAQYKVQAIFPDGDVKRTQMPQLVCYKRNSEYFTENDAFKKAVEITTQSVSRHISQFDDIHNRLIEYQEIIDGIKACYDEIAIDKEDDFRYDVFVAYEDDSKDLEQGLAKAREVRNLLSDCSLKHVFVPSQVVRQRDPLEYEASVLYALDHSNCMLVITDNNISPSLYRMYQRYFLAGNEKNGNTLGFIRYLGHTPIILPAHCHDENFFRFENTDDICEFACFCNNKVYKKRDKPIKEVDPRRVIEEKPIIPKPVVTERPAVVKNSDGTVTFGSFPQRQTQSPAVKEAFQQLGKPKMDDYNGWTVLFTDKNGVAYAWYRDLVVGNVKYRGVYYTRARDAYCARNANISTQVQVTNGFARGKIYCFEFAPLRWKVVSNDTVSTLATEESVYSSEFNNMLDNSWGDASLRNWLNDDFYNTAFSEKEQHCMFQMADDDDRVFLMNEGKEIESYCGNGRAIKGSDYMRCIGGMCMDRVISNMWILGSSELNNDKAHSVDPVNGSKVSKHDLDDTRVAVVPKIKLRLD